MRLLESRHGAHSVAVLLPTAFWKFAASSEIQLHVRMHARNIDGRREFRDVPEECALCEIEVDNLQRDQALHSRTQRGGPGEGAAGARELQALEALVERFDIEPFPDNSAK